MKKRITALLLLLVLAALLCACGSKQKNRTPEETAIMFVKAIANDDFDMFSQCVHPKMLEEWADEWLDSDPDGRFQVTEIHTGAVTDYSTSDADYDSDYDYGVKYLEDLQNSFEEFGITNITAAKTVTVYAKGYDYFETEEVSNVLYCGVFLSDGCWYAWGWS